VKQCHRSLALRGRVRNRVRDVEGFHGGGRVERGRMTNAVTVVRQLEPTEWWILRDTRLRALIESPRAFTSCLQREESWPEHEWQHRFETGTWVVAGHGDAVVGMAGLVDGHPGESRHLEAIWVAPSHRRQRVFSRLLNRVVEIARAGGLDWLPLWVLEDNMVARDVYVRRGFVWRGERQPLDPAWLRVERRLWLPI
jgi:GNAT superfamily N-acetyltransferase